MQTYLDKTKVVCQVNNCTLNKQEISYAELIKHAKQCPPKIVSCPLGCKEKITVDLNYESHFDYCKRALITCDLCKNTI